MSKSHKAHDSVMPAVHWGGSGMVLVAHDRHLDVLHPNNRLDNTDRFAGVVQNRPLLDVGLDISFEELSRDLFRGSQFMHAGKNIAEPTAVAVSPVLDCREGQLAAPHPASQERLEGSLLISEGNHGDTF